MFSTYHTHKASTFQEKQQQIRGKHRSRNLKTGGNQIEALFNQRLQLQVSKITHLINDVSVVIAVLFSNRSAVELHVLAHIHILEYEVFTYHCYILCHKLPATNVPCCLCNTTRFRKIPTLCSSRVFKIMQRLRYVQRLLYDSTAMHGISKRFDKIFVKKYTRDLLRPRRSCSNSVRLYVISIVFGRMPNIFASQGFSAHSVPHKGL